MTGITEDELERVRILNTLQQYENGAMAGAVGPDGRMRLLPLMCKTVIAVRALNKKLLEQLDEKQAKIDWLMLEYCPDEMTPEQIAEWESRQKVVRE